jgi:hypothetical protein
METKYSSAQDYIKFLISLGRNVCCYTDAEKPTNKLTLKEQEILTSLLIEESGIYMEFNETDHKTIFDLFLNCLRDSDEANDKKFMSTLRQLTIETYYEHSEKIFSAVLDSIKV